MVGGGRRFESVRGLRGTPCKPTSVVDRDESTQSQRPLNVQELEGVIPGYSRTRSLGRPRKSRALQLKLSTRCDLKWL